MATNLATLPTHTPAETLTISPEGLEIANCYLTEQDINKVAESLDIPLEMVVQTLSKNEIRTYVNHVFMNVGYNNSFKMRNAMDAIIKKKFQEMDESDTGSDKDIADLLALSHKMSMELLDKQIKLEEIKNGKKILGNQTNIQVNNGGNKYDSLMQQLLGTVAQDINNVIDVE